MMRLAALCGELSRRALTHSPRDGRSHHPRELLQIHPAGIGAPCELQHLLEAVQLRRICGLALQDIPQILLRNEAARITVEPRLLLEFHSPVVVFCELV